MKIYTLTYDDARPTKQQVNIPTNSDYKIGIKVIGSKDAGKIVTAAATGGGADAIILAEDFNLYPQQVTLVGDDGSTISADPELTNGYVTFTLKAGDEANFTKYKVQVKNDTFDGIQYSPVVEGTNSTPRQKQFTSTLSCDTPTTIYPSDKIQAVDKDGKMHPKYGGAGQSTVIYYYTVKNSAGQSIADSSYLMNPYCAEETFPGADIKVGIRRNTYAYHAGQGAGSGWYDIAAKYTDEMIADGDTLNIAYTKTVSSHSDYYIQFAVIPYENTFDLAVNTFKSQQGDIELVGSGGGVTEQWVESYVSAETSAFVDNLGGVEGIMKISQSAYDALVSAGTVVSTTCYLITE